MVMCPRQSARLGALLVVLLWLSAGSAWAGLVRVTMGDRGREANAACVPAWFTPDGRYILFNSAADNLVPGDTNGVMDAFVKDLVTGSVCRATLDSAGHQMAGGFGEHLGYTMSSDGRFVLFSAITSPVTGEPLPDYQLGTYRKDLLTGEVQPVVVTSEGAECAGLGESISADGRFASFVTGVDGVVPEDQNTYADLFVRDLELGVTEVVSVTPAGVTGPWGTGGGGLSADGRYAAFVSASELLGLEVPGYVIYVRDRQMGVTECVSLTSEGLPAAGVSVLPSTRWFSADGRYVLLTSYESLVPEATTPGFKVYLRDRQAGTTELVSATSSGEVADGPSEGYGVSGDGRYVLFTSDAANLNPEGGATSDALYLRDRVAGTTTPLTYPRDGQAWPLVASPGAGGYLSDDGLVLFVTDFPWVPSDTGADTLDVYLYDPGARFTDVSSRFWAFDNIEACVSGGVVQGYRDLTYRPTQVVSRGQMAIYLARALAGGDALVPSGPEVATFTDVSTTDSIYEYVEYAVARGVATGYSADNTYRPNEPVNRGQMAAFLARAMAGSDDLVPVPTGAPTFPDVPAGFKFLKHVEYIYAAGVTTGYKDGLYHPDATCARDQMATFVARAFGL